MVIKHNLLAFNANRQLGIVKDSLSKSIEKLSSGYKINRAADDAAGLSISEKMRKQIRGLSQASENIEDGISLCQVADGALQETTDILQRINELAIQTANGTNSTSDRQNIQEEINQLTLEIDRIANTTSFNDDIYPLRAENGFGTLKWNLPSNFYMQDIFIAINPFKSIFLDGVQYTNNGSSAMYIPYSVLGYRKDFLVL